MITPNCDTECNSLITSVTTCVGGPDTSDDALAVCTCGASVLAAIGTSSLDEDSQKAIHLITCSLKRLVRAVLSATGAPPRRGRRRLLSTTVSSSPRITLPCRTEVVIRSRAAMYIHLPGRLLGPRHHTRTPHVANPRSRHHRRCRRLGSLSRGERLFHKLYRDFRRAGGCFASP